MTDAQRLALGVPRGNGATGSPTQAPANIALGAFTTSVLFDVLALIAHDPQQAHSDVQQAAEILTAGTNGALAAIALGQLDFLQNPPAAVTSRQTRSFALDGALAAVYLLNVAARRHSLNDVNAPLRTANFRNLGLSLLGLICAGISARPR